MLGFEGLGVYAAYTLSILAALVCVVYGIWNWNKPSTGKEKKQIDEEVKWEKKDRNV